MAMVTIDEIGDKMKEWFSWDNLATSLPILGGIALGLVALDKAIDIGGKVKLLTEGTKKLNKAEFFESIDTIGDNIQLVESIFKSFKIKLGEDELNKIGDFLQNLGTAGKYITKLIDILKGQFGSFGDGGSGGRSI